MVYREVMAMVDANAALQVPSAFYTCMRTVYVFCFMRYGTLLLR